VGGVASGGVSREGVLPLYGAWVRCLTATAGAALSVLPYDYYSTYTAVGLRSTCPFCVNGGWMGSPRAARTTGIVLYSDYYNADRVSVQMRSNAFINKDMTIAHQ